MGLSEGEKCLRDLLYGLFFNREMILVEAIADASKFGRDDFVHLMNKKKRKAWVCLLPTLPTQAA